MQHVHPCADIFLIFLFVPARMLLASYVKLRRIRAAIVFI